MLDHLLESSGWDDSNKWSNIGFGEEIDIEINVWSLFWPWNRYRDLIKLWNTWYFCACLVFTQCAFYMNANYFQLSEHVKEIRYFYQHTIFILGYNPFPAMSVLSMRNILSTSALDLTHSLNIWYNYWPSTQLFFRDETRVTRRFVQSLPRCYCTLRSKSRFLDYFFSPCVFCVDLALTYGTWYWGDRVGIV